jgi:peroxin-14
MIEKNKEHHIQSLNELQQEMKSLKALLLNRPTGGPASPNPLLPITRPSIPAWQLAPSTTSRTSPGIAAPIVEPAAVTPLNYRTGSPSLVGKSKEVDTDVNAVSSAAS